MYRILNYRFPRGSFFPKHTRERKQPKIDTATTQSTYIFVKASIAQKNRNKTKDKKQNEIKSNKLCIMRDIK